MPHHAPQQRQCVPACLGTRCSRCGCCRCHRGKWKRHSSMTLLHKTVQDCTTKAVQYALATLRLLFRACSSSPPTLTSDLICFQAAQCHSIRSCPPPAKSPAPQSVAAQAPWPPTSRATTAMRWPESRRNCGGHTLFFWVKYCSKRGGLLVVDKIIVQLRLIKFGRLPESENLLLKSYPHNKRPGGIQLRLTLHNATIEWCLFSEKIFLAQFLLTVEGRASWLHWPTYALLGLRKALKIKTCKSSSNHHAPSCPTGPTAPECARLLGHKVFALWLLPLSPWQMKEAFFNDSSA